MIGASWDLATTYSKVGFVTLLKIGVTNIKAS